MATNNFKSHVLELPYEDFIQNDKKLQGLKVGKYTVTEKIGEGAYGSVWKGIDNESKQLVAIKLLDLEAVEKEKSTYLKKILRKLIKSEAQMMSICDSPHTIKCYDVYENESLKLMLMEYCKDGDLEQEVRRNKFLPENDAVIILKQILNGLAELHSNKIIHRDLKPSNILIHNQVYKIADFGFSKQLSTNSFRDQLRHTTLGTIYTMAPEIMKGSKYGLQADIWSVGVIFYFMLYGRPPYEENTYEKVLKEIQKRKIFEVKHRDSKFKLSDEAKSFISQCLTLDSQERLNWTNIVNHKLFQKYDLNESLSGSNRKAVYLNKICMMELDSKEIAINEDSTEQGSPNRYKRACGKEEATSSGETKNLRGSTCSTDSGYQWSKTAHLECQLTEFLLTQVVEQLQKLPENLLQQRQVIELLCLLSARCELNMSYKKKDLSKIQKSHATESLVKLIQKIQGKSQQKHNKHKLHLQSKKGEILQIIKDSLFSFINCQAGPSRQIFFNGVETSNERSDARSDFTKREQIEYTQKMIINVKDLLEKDKNLNSKTLSYLTNYKNICYITAQQVGKTYNLKDLIQKRFSIL